MNKICVRVEGMKKDINNLVTKSNKLIDANYKSRLTPREQKIILYIVSKIQKEDTELKTYSLSIKDFSEMMGLKGSPKYEEIEKVTKNLLSKVIEIHEEDGLIQTHWLTRVKYNYGQGTVEFNFPADLKPYLLMLKREFTSYKLKNILELKSGHSIRMYELLKKWEVRKEVQIDLERLKEMLGIDSGYGEYSNFKLRILKTAQKELEESTDISFNYKEIKKGRKVIALHFFITSKRTALENETQLLEMKQEPDDLFESLYLQLDQTFKKHDYTLTKKVLKRWVELAEEVWGDNKHMEIHKLIQQSFSVPSIENHLAFITYILNEKVKCVQKGTSHHRVSVESNSKKVIREELLPHWFKKDKKEEKTVRKGKLSEEQKREIERQLQELINSNSVKR